MTKKTPNESAGNILLTNIKVNKSSLDFLSPDNQYNMISLKPTCKYFHLRYCFPVSFVRPFPFSTIHNIPTNDPIPSPILRCKLFIYKTLVFSVLFVYSHTESKIYSQEHVGRCILWLPHLPLQIWLAVDKMPCSEADLRYSWSYMFRNI